MATITYTKLGPGGYPVPPPSSTLVQIVNEVLQVGESFLSVRGLTRLLNETVSLIESLTVARPLVRLVNEVENLVEALLTSRLLNRVVAETENVGESRLASLGLTRTFTESLNLSEVTSNLLGLTRAIAETVRIGEATNRTSLLTRAINETVRAVEAVVASVARDITKVIAETVNFVEVTLRVITPEVTRIINELLQINEAGSVPWTPAALGSTLQSWLDASDASSITITGSGVAQWNDKSGKGRHGSQTTDAKRPPYVANKVTFSGAQVLDLDAFVHYPSTYDFLIVGKPNDGTTSGSAGYSVGFQTGADHYPFLINPSRNAGVYISSFITGTGLGWASNTLGMLYGSLSDTATVAMSRDGGSPVTLMAAFGETAQPIALGSRWNVTMPFGEINEVIMIPYGASTATRQMLEGYAAWKWGLVSLLPAGHPYKSAAPTVTATGPLTVMMLNRMINEVIQIADNILPVRALVRQLAESLRVSEGTVVTQLLIHVANEVMRIGEGIVETKVIAYMINETMNLLESFLPTLALLRQTNETTQVVDAPVNVSPPVLSGLTVWLDASTLALNNNDPVPSWPDLGPATNPTMVGTPLPVYKTGQAPSGRGVVRFSAGGARLRGGHGLNQTYTTFYVTRAWGPNVGRGLTSQYPPTNYLLGFHPTVQDAMYDNAWVNPGVPWGAFPGPWKLYGADSAAGVRVRFFINGVLSGTLTTPTGMGSTYGLSGYDATAATESMDVEVGEVLIYNRMLTANERISVEQYLTAKWLVVGGSTVVVRGLNRMINEVMRIAEAISKLGVIAYAVNETVQASELVQNVRVLLRLLNEQVRVGETFAPVRSLLRLLNETVQVAEDAFSIPIILRVIGETVNAIENIVRTNLLTRTIDELVRSGEDYLFSRALLRLRDETVNLIEESEGYLALLRLLGEDVTVPEDIEPARELVRPQDEDVNVPEGLVPSRGRTQIVSEFLHLPEVFNFIATIPSLVCSAIRIYAVIAGECAIAPVVMGGATSIGPVLDADRTGINPAVLGMVEIDPVLDAERTGINPELEAEVKIEECC